MISALHDGFDLCSLGHLIMRVRPSVPFRSDFHAFAVARSASRRRASTIRTCLLLCPQVSLLLCLPGGPVCLSASSSPCQSKYPRAQISNTSVLYARHFPFLQTIRLSLPRIISFITLEQERHRKTLMIHYFQ